MEPSDDALCALGYNVREASWLRLVMVHSGVFLRRQYLAFLGHRTAGAIDQRLLTRLVRRQHATVFHYRGGERGYHLRARALYAAIGQEHSRHRRAIPPLTLAHRLLALDYLIHHPDDYLAGEADTVLTMRSWGIEPRHWPTRVYRSQTDRLIRTTRYFVEQYPMAVDNGAVRLIVPDLAPLTAAAMRHAIRHYGAVLRAVRGFELVYVTARGTCATVAERLFRRAFSTHEDDDVFGAVVRALAMLEAIKTCQDAHMPATESRHWRAWRNWLSTADREALSSAWQHRQMDAIKAYIAQHGLTMPRRFRHVAMPWRYTVPDLSSASASGQPSATRRVRRGPIEPCAD